MEVIVKGPPIPDSILELFPGAIGIAIQGDEAHIVRDGFEEWWRIEDRGDRVVFSLARRREPV